MEEMKKGAVTNRPNPLVSLRFHARLEIEAGDEGEAAVIAEC